MSDVYEDILNEAASWTAVARPDGQDGWTDSSAPIRLVEQDPRGGLTPLFAAVAEALFNRPVIAAVVALFDNYNPFEGQPDVQLSDLEHSQEIEALLDAIMPTVPMQLAARYLRAVAPNEFPDDNAVRAWTRQVWFEPFVNEYSVPEETARDSSTFSLAKCRRARIRATTEWTSGAITRGSNTPSIRATVS